MDEPAITQLTVGDVASLRRMLAMFGTAFEDPETYRAAPPSDAWLAARLGDRSLIALTAVAGGEVVGGIAAFELTKYEQERRELYIYDLAVAEDWRRRGVATKLIAALRAIARERGAFVVFVQADPEDAPAVALYETLGRRADVYHFDIAP